MKKVLIGIQPSGRLHIGNYLGVIKEGIDLQTNFNVVFMIAGYHAMSTTPAHEVSANSSMMRKTLKRLGAKTVHEQTIAPDVLMAVMSATKQSSLQRIYEQNGIEDGNVISMIYPALMAHDIISINPHAVLVGVDQERHMELYRDVCEKLSMKAASTLSSKYPSIKSIKDPTKKMSKSLGDDHCIYIDDTREEMLNKIRRSPTTDLGLINLSRIAKAFGVNFNPKNCAESKEILANTIFDFFNGGATGVTTTTTASSNFAYDGNGSIGYLQSIGLGAEALETAWRIYPSNVSNGGPEFNSATQELYNALSEDDDDEDEDEI